MTETKTFAELMLSVKAKVWDEMPLMLHTQVATGEYKEKPFKIIQNVGNHTFFISYDNKVYELGLRSLMDALFDKLEENK